MDLRRGTYQKKSPTGMPWFANVAKSLGYTSQDLVTSLTPSIGEFISSNKDFTQETIRDIRDFRSGGGRVNDAFKQNTTIGIAQEALKNALSDIKSGKIHNKERIEKHMFGDDDFSMDFDGDDFGLVDIDDSDDGSSKGSAIPKITVNVPGTNINKNNPMVKAIQQQSAATITAADAQVSAMQSIASTNMMFNQKLGSGLITGLETMNSNIGMLVNFQNDSMTKYIGASLKYYEDSLTTLNQTLLTIKGENTPTSNRPNYQSDSMFLSNGGLDLSAYAKIMKKNFSEALDGNPFGMVVKGILEDSDTLKMLAQSPVSFISTKLVTTLIPTFFQRSLSKLNESFESFFPAMMMRINRLKDNQNPILDFIGQAFGVKTSTKSSVDMSKYQRGQIPFDGETKKSIVEVIPGYLRKILAAVSGSEELAYDFDRGQFRKVSTMQKDFQNDRLRKAEFAYMEAIDKIKAKSGAVAFENEKDRSEFENGMKEFFLNLSKQNKLINPYKTKDKNGFEVDELKDVFDFNGNEGLMNLFRKSLLSLPKRDVRRIFGADTLNANKEMSEFYRRIEENPTNSNAATLFNMLGYDEHLKTVNGKKVSKAGSLLNPVDRFNHSSLDYLRDIKETLLRGIRVFIDPSKQLGDGGGSDSAYHSSALNKMQQEVTNVTRKEQAARARRESRIREFTPEQQASLQGQGKTVVSGSYDLMDADSVEQMIGKFDAHNKAKKEEAESKKGSAGKWLGKFLKGNSQDKYNMVADKVINLLQKPAQLLEGVFTRVDNMMHKLVFGTSGEGENTSFFARSMAAVNTYYKKMGSWMTSNVVTPVKEALVGEHGILTKIKESDMFKDMKSGMKNFSNFMFGKPDASGKRRDGLLGNTGNEMLDMFDGMKYYFTGNPYTNRFGKSFARNEESVIGQVRTMGANVSKSVKQYLFGDKESENDAKKKGTLGGVMESISLGFSNFRDAIFGPKGMTKENTKYTFDQLKDTVKKRMPKSLAWGIAGTGVGVVASTGLLGSLLLPGGPLGAAVIGSALGFASQSDRFNNFLFGEKDARGERLGGFISSKTQDFFRKNKATLVGGAAIGSLNLGQFILPALSFGLLPAMTMGPMMGAVTGMGIAMALRSETMQNALFGKKDMDGKRAGGVLGKMMSKMKGKDGKNLFGNMGAGALGGAGLGTLIGQFGLLGLAFGPVTGAIGGAVAGIALTEDKWKKALFGEWDVEAGARKGGVLGKFVNFMQMEVVKPFGLQMEQIKLNMGKWFTQSIANPFTDAIDPLKQSFRNMTVSLNKYFVEGWESFKEKIGQTFENHVGKPFGIFMKEQIMDPMKSFFSKLLGGIGRILKPFAEAPIKMLSAFSNGFVANRQEKRGVRKMREAEDARLAKQKEEGMKVGLFSTKDQEGRKVDGGRFESLRNKYFSKEKRESAKFGEEGAWYNSPEEKAKRAKRNADQNSEYDARQAALDEKKARLDKRRRVAFKYDFDNFTEDGRSLKFIYKSTKNVSRFKQALENENVGNSIKNSVSDYTGGVGLSEILGRGKEDIDPASLSRKDGKLLKKALNVSTQKGIVGDELRRYLNIAVEEKEAVQEQTKATEQMSEQVNQTLERVAEVANVKDLVAPRIDETNSRLSGVIETLKSGFAQFAKDEGGFVRIPGRTPVAPKQKVETSSTFEAPVIGTSSQPRATTTAGVSASTLATDMPHEKDKKSSTKFSVPKMIERIMTYTRKTAQEVSGQLDGVGSNVFKIRKMIQKQHGIEDDDLKGSANRDRVGFWGGIRRAVFKPFEIIGDKISAAFNVVKDKLIAFKDGVVKVTKAVLAVPKMILDGVVGGIKLIGKGVGKVLKVALLDIPLKLAKGVAKTSKFIYDTAIKIGSGAMKGLKLLGQGVVTITKGLYKNVGKLVNGLFTAGGKLLSGLGSLGQSLLKAGGKAVEGLVSAGISIGRGVGTVVKGVTSGLWKLTKGVRDVGAAIFDGAVNLTVKGIKGLTNGLVTATKQIASWTGRTIKSLGETIAKIGSSLLKVVASPFKWMAGKAAKWAGIARQEVTVVGGVLDSVRHVEHVGKQEYSTTSADGRGLTIGHLDNSIYTSITEAITRGIRAAQPIIVQMSGGHHEDSSTPPSGDSPHPSSSGNVGGALRNFRSAGAGIRGKIGSLMNFNSTGRVRNMAGRLGGSVFRSLTRNPIETSQRAHIRASMGIGNLVDGFHKVWNGGVTHFQDANQELGTSRFAQQNNGRVLGNGSSVSAAHALNEMLGGVNKQGITGNMMTGNSGIVGMLGGLPSNLAMAQRPALEADIQHKYNSRRTADYENEQRRIKEEREFLQNYRVTMMTHVEYLDDNVYEILEILRKWPHCCDKKLPIPPIPPMIPGGGGSGSNPKVKIPEIKVKIPQIKIPAIEVKMPQWKWPAMPEFKWPQLPKWNWPALPKFPSFPMIPGLPQIPGIPKIPGMPSIPKIPWFPMPKIPGMPKIPKIPSIPMPKIPWFPKKLPKEVPDAVPSPYRTPKPGEKPYRKPAKVPTPKGPPVEVPERPVYPVRKPGEVVPFRPKTNPQPKPSEKPAKVPAASRKEILKRAWQEYAENARKTGIVSGGNKGGNSLWKELLKDEAGRVRMPSFKLPKVFTKDGFKNKLSNWGDDFRDFKSGWSDTFSNTGKNLTKFGTGAKNFGTKLANGRNKLVDGALDWAANTKLGGAVDRISNSKFGKALGKGGGALGRALGPIFGTIGATKQNARTGAIFDTKDPTDGQKFSATLGGFLTNGTVLALPKLMDGKKFNDDEFAKELYSLKNPVEWAKTYGKKGLKDIGQDFKNIFDPSTWAGKQPGAKEGLIPKLIRTTGLGGVTKKFIGGTAKKVWEGGQETLFGDPNAVSNWYGSAKLGLKAGGKAIATGASDLYDSAKFGLTAGGKAIGNKFTSAVDSAKFGLKAGGKAIKNSVDWLFGGDNKVGAAGKDDDFTVKAKKKAKDTWDKLTEKTNSAWDNVASSVSTSTENVRTKTKEKWEGLKKDASTKWSNVATAVADKTKELRENTKAKWDGLKKDVGTKWHDISTKAKDKAKEMYENTKEKWGDMKKSVGTKWTDLTDKAKKKAHEMWEGTKEKWDDMKTKVSGKWKDLTTKAKNKAKEMYTDTQEKWDDMKTKVAGKWKDLTGKAKKKAHEMYENTKEKWDDMKSKVAGKWKDLTDKAKKKAKEMYDNTKEKWDDMKSKVAGRWADLTDKAKKKAKEMYENTKEKWDDMKSKVAGRWTDLTDKAKKKAKEMYENTKEKWDDMKTKVASKWTDLTDKAKTKAKEMYDNTKEKWDNMKSTVGTHWTNLTDKAKKKASEMWEDAKEKWDDVKDSVGKKWKDMKTKAPDFAKGVYDGIHGMMTTAKDAVKDYGTKVADKAKSIWSKLFGGGDSSDSKKSKGKGKKDKDHGGGAAKMVEQYSTNRLAHGGGTSAPQIQNGGVYYSQNDKRWAGQSFGGQQTMGDIGCAPTSAAMVISSMTGQNVTPAQMASQAVGGGYVNPELGTHKSFFTDSARYGVKFKEAGRQDLANGLMQNKPVILRGESGPTGPYTQNGHYIVATGMTRDGKILVNDPLSKERSKAYNATELLSKTTSSFVPEYADNKAAKVTAKGGKAPRANFGSGGGNKQSCIGKGASITGLNHAYGGGLRKTSGALAGSYVTSEYGSPRNATPPKGYHTGIDLVDTGGNKTRPIKSFTNGTVMTAKYSGGWGNLIIIRDENGYDHYYAHLSSIGLKVGQKIKKGSVIGRQGNTGRVFGAGGGYHLHYQVNKPGTKHGQANSDVNPEKYLAQYKGSKSFIGDLVSGIGSVASSVAGSVGGLIESAASGISGFLTDTFNLESVKSMHVFSELTKAYGIFQANLYLKDKVAYAQEQAATGANGEMIDYSNVNYGIDVRKYNPKKKYKGKFEDIINATAKRYNVEPQLIAAIIKQESGFNPSARSGAGAAGLMQLMPATARGLGVSNSLDPAQNVNGGTKYITSQLRTYKSLKNALMAYNWGPGNASKAGFNLGIAPSETRGYVTKVIGNLQHYRKQVGGGYGGGGVLPQSVTEALGDLPHGGGTTSIRLTPPEDLPYGGGGKVVPIRLTPQEDLPYGGGDGKTLSEILSNVDSMSQSQRVTEQRDPQGFGAGKTDGLLEFIASGSTVRSTNTSTGKDTINTVIDLLSQIAGNTSETAKNVSNIKQTSNTIVAPQTTNVAVNNNKNGSKPHNSNPMISALNDKKNAQLERDLKMASAIAQGR